MTPVSSSPRLKLALAADAAAVLAVAVLQLALVGVIADWLLIPSTMLLATGAFLLPWGGLLLWLARQDRLAPWVVLLVVDVNLLWAMAALALLLTDVLATGLLGQAYLVLNAVLALVFAVLQWQGLRASRPAAVPAASAAAA